MNRNETIALFERCEAKRAEALAAATVEALAYGGSDDGARAIAHEAAKAVWNAWAAERLAERKALEGAGGWAAEKDWKGDLEPKNEDTRQWLEAARANFRRCRFLVGEAQVTAEEVKEENASPGETVESIHLSSNAVNFSGFVFPGPALFDARGP